jgi:hypothetical protein
MNDTLNERFGRDQPIVHIGVLVAAADRTDRATARAQGC